MEIWAIVGLGFVLGLRHALDADHVIAVSTIVADTQSLLKAASIGALWGVGHTLTLSLVGLLILFGKVSIPESWSHIAELFVGLMLVYLGFTTLLKLRRERLHAHHHRHGSLEHTHFHSHSQSQVHDHSHPGRISWKPLYVGMIHGLAGSAALLLLVLSSIRSPWYGLFYIMLFGMGSIVGMILISLALGLPLVWTARSLERGYHNIGLVAGVASVILGAWLIFEIGFLEGVFLR